jgi:hypothetical protein
MTSRRLLLVGIAAVLSTACAPHEDGESTKPGTPEVEPKDPTRAEPEPSKQLATVTIASVQMIQDCPEQDATPAAGPRPAPGAPAAPMPPADEGVRQDESRAARGASVAGKPGYAPIRQPCTQSTMQLSFTGQGPTSAKVKIEAVRVLAASGDELGTVNARLPTAWKQDGTYQTWDETIAPETDVKASYKLSVPNWNDVEAKLGDRNPFETKFVLEVDVEVGGELQTVRSPEFVREHPHVIVT